MLVGNQKFMASDWQPVQFGIVSELKSTGTAPGKLTTDVPFYPVSYSEKYLKR